MTQATMARPDAPRRTVPPLSLVALVVAGALVCVGMALAVRDPDVVDHVTIDNPSAVEVTVDVRSAPGAARLLLPTISAGNHATSNDVLDQGDEWIFGFSSGGIQGGTLRMSRAMLAADGWRVVVPNAVIERLQAASFVPADR
jgi:hypothetical protein